MEAITLPLEYQVVALAFRVEGAITHFAEHLPREAVGITDGSPGPYDVYRALLDYHEKTGLDPINSVAFRDWLEHETYVCAALGGPEVVKILVEAVMDLELADAESVTNILRYRYNKRQQLNFTQELQTLINQKEGRNDEQISHLTDQIRSLENELDYNPLSMVVTGHDIADRASGLWELPDFLPTQFKDLNKALGYDPDKGGFCKGAVHAVIAASGKGKSTFSKCLMNHWVDQGHTVLYVNYEEARAHWERILLTQITKQNVYLMAHDSHLKEGLTAEFQEKLRGWGDRFMVRHDPETPYFEDLERWLRDIRGHNAGVPDVIIIDTIQSMFVRGTAGRPRWGEFEVMMVRLEKLARDLNCVLIITAQENANRMKEGRDVVKQTDTGGSLTIQTKCAVTIFITEKKLLAGNEDTHHHVMELQIPKNRITGDAFAMDPARVQYNDMTKSYEECTEVFLEPRPTRDVPSWDWNE